MSLKVKVHDKLSFTPSQREITPEGFLRAPAYVARTGVQEYKASELGLSGDPNRIVRVYRPEDAVFDEKSLKKYLGLDITIEHPDNFVNSDNFKTLNCGTVLSEGIRDGDHVKCDLIIKDKDAIDKVLNGKDELSVGYEAVYLPDPTGEYDFIQREIEPNHIAITDKARAGHTARIFDSKGKINMRKVTIDGVEIEVDANIAQHIEKLTTDRDTIKAERDNDRAEVKRLKEERKEDDYDVEKLRARVRELEDEKVEREKEKATEDAKKLVGDSAPIEGDSPIGIKRKALDSLGFDTKGESDDYVKALFDMQLASKATVDSQHSNLASDVNNAKPETVVTIDSVVEAKREEMIARLTRKDK